MANNIERVTKHLCQCIRAPMGNSGLEGYILGNFYRCEHVVRKNDSYYRVFPDWSFNYYETCGSGTFHKHFRIVDSARLTNAAKQQLMHFDWLDVLSSTFHIDDILNNQL